MVHTVSQKSELTPEEQCLSLAPAPRPQPKWNRAEARLVVTRRQRRDPVRVLAFRNRRETTNSVNGSLLQRLCRALTRAGLDRKCLL